MNDTCANPVKDRHAVLDGARRLEIVLRTDWGIDDLRATHEKPLAFCSFACMRDWAGQRSIDHDQTVVREG